MDATRELSRTAYEFRTTASPQGLMRETSRMVESALGDIEGDAPPRPAKSSNSAPEDETKYRAWLPPDDSH
jgi:hypothetical protein